MATMARLWFGAAVLVFLEAGGSLCSGSEPQSLPGSIEAEEATADALLELGGHPWRRASDQPISGVTFHGEKMTDATLEKLVALGKLKWFPLIQSLKFVRTRITDAGLEKFKELKWLELIDCNLVTDVGLKELKELRELSLVGGHVTDEWLKGLKGLQKLQVLWLYRTPKLTNSGLKALKELKDLRKLNIHGNRTGFTRVGFQDLEKGLPKLRINY